VHFFGHGINNILDQRAKYYHIGYIIDTKFKYCSAYYSKNQTSYINNLPKKQKSIPTKKGVKRSNCNTYHNFKNPNTIGEVVGKYLQNGSTKCFN